MVSPLQDYCNSDVGDSRQRCNAVKGMTRFNLDVGHVISGGACMPVDTAFQATVAHAHVVCTSSHEQVSTQYQQSWPAEQRIET